jgi:hypothetical protein
MLEIVDFRQEVCDPLRRCYPHIYLRVLEHVYCCLREILEPTIVWRDVSYPGSLRNCVSCHIDRLLESKRLSGEVSQLVVLLGRKALSGYYGPQGVVEYCVEEVRYQGKTV